MQGLLCSYHEGIISIEEYSRREQAEDRVIQLAQMRKYSFLFLERIDNNYTETGKLDNWKLSFY